MINAKLERVQWPVGHGGFHTGKLQVGDKTFEYVFDCGSLNKAGKSLIRETLALNTFDIAVVSHFDNDHVEFISAVEAKTIFVPYLTRTDIVLLVAALLHKGERAVTKSVVQLLQGYQNLKANPDVIWVGSDVRGPGDPYLQDGEFTVDGISVNRDANGLQTMHHTHEIDVGLDEELLHFKFYNHRSRETSDAFRELLEEAITESDPAKKMFYNTAGVAYTTLEEFLTDIENDPTKVVGKNKQALKDIYLALLDPMTIGDITPFNLSSLTLLTTPLQDADDDRSYTRILESRFPYGWKGATNRGWMLTGDLELYGAIWDGFYKHYFLELETCRLLNVPHHGSSASLAHEALRYCSDIPYLVVSAKKGDGKHPHPDLKSRLDIYGMTNRFVVTEDETSYVRDCFVYEYI